MIKSSAVRLGICALVGLVIWTQANRAQASHVFSADFETGTIGTAIGTPAGAPGFAFNGSVGLTSTYAGPSPFVNGGAQFGDLFDPDPTAGTGQTIRVLSNVGNDNSLTPFLSGQISTYSYDFIERSPNEAVGAGLIMGYYRQQGNPDLNSTGRNYSSNLHDGSLNPTGTLLGGLATPYTVDTINTVFMMVNDSLAPLADYQPGHTLAATSADFWILRPGDVSPVYAFSVAKQSLASPIAGVGFRTNSGDAEHFAVDNVFVNSGATFDRSLTGPAIATIVVNRTTGQVSIQNRDAANISVKGYTISSAAGSLSTVGWSPIADTGDADSGGSFDATGVWSKTSTLTTSLAESTSTGTGGQLVATTGSQSIGNAWLRTPFQDLSATYIASDGSVKSANVVYEGTAPTPGDINGDGVINAADWSLFVAGSGASFTGQTPVQAFLQGDLDGNLVNNFADFRLFKADYDGANGQGAFSKMVAGVPEPSTIVLVATGVIGIVFGKRSRRLFVWLCLITCVGVFVSSAKATVPETFIATSAPGTPPSDGLDTTNANAPVLVWTAIQQVAAAGTAFAGNSPTIPSSHWNIFNQNATGYETVDHYFNNASGDPGTPLGVGQAVSMDFANRSVAAIGVVGIQLYNWQTDNTAATPFFTFKLPGANAVAGGTYLYDDAGGANQNTTATYASLSMKNFEFRLDSPTTYTAAFGGTSGTTIWTGTIPSGAQIDAIRVFDNQGSNNSDLYFDNLKVGVPTSIIPLSLEVNRASGEIKIKGNATLAANLDYYQITSAGNSLNFASGTGAHQWNSLDLQNIDAVDGSDPGSVAGDSLTEGWDKASNASKGRLSEYFVRSTGSTLSAAGTRTLGDAYDSSVFGNGNGDLAFTYGITGSSKLLTGTVTYIGTAPAGVVGDYNGNGIVDAADYTVWRDHLGQSFALQNRDPANGSGPISANDYTSWKSNFGAHAGSGAGSSLSAVPEPSSIALLIIGALAFVARRR